MWKIRGRIGTQVSKKKVMLHSIVSSCTGYTSPKQVSWVHELSNVQVLTSQDHERRNLVWLLRKSVSIMWCMRSLLLPKNTYFAHKVWRTSGRTSRYLSTLTSIIVICLLQCRNGIVENKFVWIHKLQYNSLEHTWPSRLFLKILSLEWPA